MSMATIVEPTGVPARMATRIPVREQTTEMMAAAMVTVKKLLKLLDEIDDVQTNSPETIGYSNYIFFGFDLSTIEKIDRCAGISIEYQLISDDYITSHSEENWKHCLLLYELFLPGSTWH